MEIIYFVSVFYSFIRDNSTIFTYIVLVSTIRICDEYIVLFEGLVVLNKETTPTTALRRDLISYPL